MTYKPQLEEPEKYNEYLESIGSPFRLGVEYNVRNGTKVKAFFVSIKKRPRVHFTDGLSRNAKNGRMHSRNLHSQDIVL